MTEILSITFGLDSVENLTEMENKHKEAIKLSKEKVKEAKENFVNMEILDARLEAAWFAAKSLSKEMALVINEKALDLPKLLTGKKINALMKCSRVGSFHIVAKTDPLQMKELKEPKRTQPQQYESKWQNNEC